jgi:hypothetical protein
MNKKTFIFFLISLLIGGLLCFPVMASNQNSNQCANIINSKEADGTYDPIYIGVLLTQECANVFVREVPKDAPAIVLHAGFPSAVDGVVPSNRLLEYLLSIVEGGEHEYFNLDGEINSLLDDLAKDDIADASKIANIRDFVLASQEGGDLSRVSDKRRFASYLPIWRNDQQRETFRNTCKEVGCPNPGSAATICKTSDFLALKMQYASSPREVISAFEQCPTSTFDAAFVQSLRKYGMIETFCSSTIQINEIRRRGFIKGSNCTNLIENIGFNSSVTSTDVLAFMRLYKNSQLPKMDPDTFAKNLKTIRGMSPRTASLIENRDLLENK